MRTECAVDLERGASQVDGRSCAGSTAYANEVCIMMARAMLRILSSGLPQSRHVEAMGSYTRRLIAPKMIGGIAAADRRDR